MSEKIEVQPEMVEWLEECDNSGWSRKELIEILKGNYAVKDKGED